MRLGMPERIGLAPNRSSREVILRWSYEAIEGDLGKPALTLMPDDFIAVEATGLGIASGTIFQVTSKDWSVEAGVNLNYKATFEAKKVTT